ncbi:hypothetical protein RZS08_04790, partial [Arthrospira platensis SPKY1]|nr:hypothetical protein [Arthrospira platensis SPKY1]
MFQRLEIGPVEQLDVATEVALAEGRRRQHVLDVFMATGDPVTARCTMQPRPGPQPRVEGIGVPNQLRFRGI